MLCKLHNFCINTGTKDLSVGHYYQAKDLIAPIYASEFSETLPGRRRDKEKCKSRNDWTEHLGHQGLVRPVGRANRSTEVSD